ncbi:MAG: LysE family transporter, partial [Rhodobacterales bacterium]|nr:LysE family transporter [Rhodobacterales bacterium]
MLTVGLTGFFTSLSLILAIGAQNTMLLRQGLTKQHIFWACIFCSVSDAILILFGIFGFDFAASKIPNLA